VQPTLAGIGGLEVLPPLNEPANFSLRRNTTASINVSGDITGDVVAGQLYRVDALRTEAGVGGTISGNLRAVRGDGTVLGLDGLIAPAIGFVRAGWSITGDIIAEGESDGSGASLFTPNVRATWGSVGSVIVGPALASPGIRGDILAEYGLINEVVTSGQIGSGRQASERTKIRAGLRIGRIATRDLATSEPNSPQSVLDRDVFADVSPSVRGINAGAAGLAFGLASSLSLLQTNGDFVGKLELHDVFGLNDSSGPTHLGTERSGIFVGGDFVGDIDVAYSYQYADIIARSFRGDAELGFSGRIRIGQMLKGAIVAVGTEGSTDPLDGTMGEVEVGYAPDISGAPRPNGRGFCGTQINMIPPPFEGTARGAWYTAVNNEIAGTIGGVI
jgi:hypothetical protein